MSAFGSRAPVLAWLLAVQVAGANPAWGEDRVVFVPVVSVLTETRPLPGGGSELRSWRTSNRVRNFGPATAAYSTLPFFAGPCVGPASIEPGSSRPLCDGIPRDGIDFLAVQLPKGMVVSAELRRLSDRVGCGLQSLVRETVTLGRVPLPVFDELIPAGVLGTSNHIELGGANLTSLCSTLPRDLHRRRVNLTLANGGLEPATFVVRLYSLSLGQFDEKVFELGPRAVAQFNGIQPSSVPRDSGQEVYSESFWLSVSSDQPFLGYASSIFEGGGPESMPLEVFPLRRLP